MLIIKEVTRKHVKENLVFGHRALRVYHGDYRTENGVDYRYLKCCNFLLFPGKELNLM